MASRGSSAKAKGSAFERKIAKLFTEWWRESFKEGEFYKTPASGGLRWQKRDDVIGDLCTPSDFAFTVECKNQEDWDFRELFKETASRPPKIYMSGKNKGKKKPPRGIGEFWHQACDEAKRADRRPMLVFTRNHFPDYVIVREKDVFGHKMALSDRGVVKDFLYEDEKTGRVEKDRTIIMQLVDFLQVVDPVHAVQQVVKV